MKRGLVGFVVAAAALAFATPTVAAPPVLTSVSHVSRHPGATWALPPGVKSQEVEVAVSPATSTDGYFLFENVRAFDVLEDAQTNWIYNVQLDPGTYYVHVAGVNEVCFYAGLCPIREFSQTMTLVIAAPPPPRPPPPPPTPPPPSPSTTSKFGFANGYHQNTLEEFQKQASIGATWNRVDFSWDSIETSPGVYQWAAYDALVDRANAAGVRLIANLSETPAFYRPAGTTDKHEPSSQGETAYANFVRAVVERYRPRGVTHYEIWNEPNLTMFWNPKPNPAKYTRMLIGAYEQAKLTALDITVLAGSFAPAGGYPDAAYQVGQVNVNGIRFLESMYANGARGKFDALSFHPYWSPTCTMTCAHYQNAWHQMAGTSPSLRSVMSANGDGAKLIHATETGQQSRGLTGATETTQAINIGDAVRLWKTYSWAGVLHIYIQREYMNGGADDFASYGLWRSDGTTKPAWSAYDTAIDG